MFTLKSDTHILQPKNSIAPWCINGQIEQNKETPHRFESKRNANSAHGDDWNDDDSFLFRVCVCVILVAVFSYSVSLPSIGLQIYWVIRILMCSLCAVSWMFVILSFKQIGEKISIKMNKTTLRRWCCCEVERWTQRRQNRYIVAEDRSVSCSGFYGYRNYCRNYDFFSSDESIFIKIKKYQFQTKRKKIIN